MKQNNIIQGFSGLSREDKLSFVSRNLKDSEEFVNQVQQLRHPDPEVESRLSAFSENTLTNFPLPFGVAPNFLINDRAYILPMVIEESSVVAASAAGARFWFERGGFRASVKKMLKTGQLHFQWRKNPEILWNHLDNLKSEIVRGIAPITRNMEARGGGLKDIQLIDFTKDIPGSWQLMFSFDTRDSMGANFINSVLEKSSLVAESYFDKLFPAEDSFERVMAILSNYTPECLVKVEVECPVKDLKNDKIAMSGEEFAQKFIRAVQIAKYDVYRAVTHNKGIYNGIDAVVVATGNDYRAAEAAGHAWAAREGKYSSLSWAELRDGIFNFGLEIPLSIGTVGGLTSLHPLAKWSFEILGNPGAEELMHIAASAGLANNFSAIRSLVTVGIQKGHMKMHLDNILSFFNADENERIRVRNEFADKTISHSEVKKFLKKLRAQ